MTDLLHAGPSDNFREEANSLKARNSTHFPDMADSFAATTFFGRAPINNQPRRADKISVRMTPISFIIRCGSILTTPTPSP